MKGIALKEPTLTTAAQLINLCMLDIFVIYLYVKNYEIKYMHPPIQRHLHLVPIKVCKKKLSTVPHSKLPPHLTYCQKIS